MKFKDLRRRIKTPFFSTYQVEKLFLEEPKNQIDNQLSRMAARGDLTKLKRSLFAFQDRQIDELMLANWLYRPSYVSLESALNLYGLMPDVSANLTSVSPTTSKKIITGFGTFLYSKINFRLFFGFSQVESGQSGLFYDLAFPEKALLDYIYIRKIKDLEENRIETANFDRKKLAELAQFYPLWVRKVIQ